MEKILQSGASTQHLQNIKHLRITGPRLPNGLMTRVRCSQGDILILPYTGRWISSSVLSASLTPLLNRLIDNCLRKLRYGCQFLFVLAGLTPSLSWELATCLPREILEYFSTRQTEIHSLTFVSRDNCCAGQSKQHHEAVRRFRKLREISCLCHRRTDIELLQMCLEVNAHHLLTLAVSFFWSYDLKSSCLAGVVGMRYIRETHLH